MNIFGKKLKKGKLYTTEEALQILSQKKYKDCTALEKAPDKWSIITMKESRKLETGLRKQAKFHDRISDRKNYANTVIPAYEYHTQNQIQSYQAKGFEK